MGPHTKPNARFDLLDDPDVWSLVKRILKRLASPPLKLRVVASERLVIAAPDLVLRTSGLLPTKPTRVTVFFMIDDLSKLFFRPRAHPFD